MQKDGLNMNPACSISLGMYEWWRSGFIYYTNTEAHVNSVIFGLRISLHDDMNLQAVRVTS